jgi:hypothetical protein
LISVFWALPFEGAPSPILPAYTDDGGQVYAHGRATGEGFAYDLLDNSRNRAIVAALPPAFSHFGSVEDPREAIMARLRELGIPHKKNEKLETLKRKLDA